jgi:hypothetical protein
MGAVAAHCIRSRWFSAACLAVVILSLVLPPGGFGVMGCHFKLFTQLPCLGCGLTRSFIGIAHLNFARAIEYHPVGIPLFFIALGSAALLPFRASALQRFAAWAEQRDRALNYVGIALLVVFVIYGLARIAVWAALLQAGQPVPW